MPDNPVGTVVAVLVIGVMALVAINIFGAVGSVAVDLGTTSGETSYNPEVGETETLDHDVDEVPSFWKISLTKGYGIRLGGDGYVATSAPANWTDSSWTACTTGRLDENYNDQAAYTLFAADNESILIQYDDGRWAGYHERDGSSARTTLPATEPTTWTALCLMYENDTDSLLLYRDGEKSGIGNFNGASRPAAHNWVGDVDEVRLFAHALNDSEAELYGEEPVAGLGVEDSARWMFEEGEGATTSAFYHDSSAALEGDAAWTQGLESPELVEGEDYERGTAPLDVTPIAGGLIDASPILHVKWATGLGGHFATVMDGITSTMQLVPILLLVLVASLIVGATARLRQ